MPFSASQLVSAPQAFSRGIPWIGAGLTTLLILLVGLSSILAVNPAFHDWLHPDSDQNHQCAATLLQKQQYHASDPGPLIVVMTVGPEHPVCFSFFLIPPSAEGGFFQSRAPPEFLLL